MHSFRFRYVDLIVFLLMCTGTQATDSSAFDYVKRSNDSLRNLLHEPGLTEKRKLEIMEYIVNNNAIYNPDSTIAWGRKTLSLAEKLNETEKEIGICFHVGASWCFKNDYDSAFIYLDRAKRLAIKMKDKLLETGANSLYAYAYVQQGKYLTAIDYYLKILSVYESTGKVNSIVGVLANLAEINRNLGNSEVAIQYLHQAEERSEELKKEPYTKSQRYEWIMPQIFNEYAAVYLQQGNLSKATEYAEKADSMNNYGILNKNQTKRLLAEIYLQSGHYDRALQYAAEALNQAEILKEKVLFINAWQILSDIYLAQGHYPEAEAEALKAWQADSTNIYTSRGIAKNIATANIYMHNDAKAAYYLDKYAELNRLYSEKSFQVTMSDMTTKYEMEKKELRISDLEQQKLLYIITGMICLILAILIWIFLHQKIRNEQREKQLIAANAVLEWEKKERKRFASDLHDGINGMLAAIKFELSTVENLQNIRERIDECIEAIRSMSRSRMPTSLKRYGLKASLEDYCHLFPNVDFHFFGENRRMDEKLELTVYYCAYELVNNAFKYSNAKNINVQLMQDGNSVSLTVQDDGCGFDEQSAMEGSGLKNIRDRVASFNGQMDIATSPGKGTEINIELKGNTIRL